MLPRNVPSYSASQHLPGGGGGGQPKIPGKNGKSKGSVLPPPNATPSQERRLYEGVILLRDYIKIPLEGQLFSGGKRGIGERCPSNSHDIVERFVVEAVAAIAWNHR